LSLNIKEERIKEAIVFLLVLPVAAAAITD
jgi:hypothetical protein